MYLRNNLGNLLAGLQRFSNKYYECDTAAESPRHRLMWFRILSSGQIYAITATSILL